MKGILRNNYTRLFLIDGNYPPPYLSRYISIWRAMFIQKRVIISCRIPGGLELLQRILGNTLEVIYDTGVDPMDHSQGKALMRFTDCQERRKWSVRPIAESPQQVKPVTIYVEYECSKMEIFSK